MAYTQMSIQDFIDTWNVAKVRYLENGIINNDERLNKLFTNDFSLTEEELNIIKNKLGIGTDDGLFDLFFFLVFMLNFSDMGKKIYRPSISFDGDLYGKDIIPLPPIMSPDNPEEVEIQACYVKVSNDALKSEMVIGTMGGFLNLMMLSLLEGDSSMGEMSILLPMMLSVHMRGEDNQYYCDLSGLFPPSSEETSDPIGDLFKNPTILTYETDFIIDGISYSKGTYALYLTSNSMEQFSEGISISGGSFYFIEGIWDLQNLNETFDNDNLLWKNINFGPDSGLEVSGNIIKINPLKSLQYTPPYFLKIGSDPLQFISAFKEATFLQIRVTEDNNDTEIIDITLSYDEENNMYALLVADEPIILMPLDLFTFEDEGEYFTLSKGIYIFPYPFSIEIICHGIDVEKKYSNKLPTNFYNQIAFERPQIEYGKNITYKYNDSDELFNLVHEGNSLGQFALLYKELIDLENINALQTAYRQRNIVNTVSLETSDQTINDAIIYPFSQNENTYTTTNLGISNSVSSSLIRLNHKVTEITITTNNPGFYISEVGGPSYPNPFWKTTSSEITSYKYTNIKAGSFIWIMYPYNSSASFTISCNPYSDYKDTYVYQSIPSEQFSQATISNLASSVQGFYFDGDTVPALINILTDNTYFGGTTLSKGLYGPVFKLDSNLKVSYISKVGTKDVVYEPIIFPIDPKFISTETPVIKQASVGQIIRVKEVDSYGKPISWEAIDFPKATTVPSSTSTNVTAAEFNSLLNALKAAGLMEV